MDRRIEEIIAFWTGLDPSKWFARDDALDATLRERFAPWIEDALSGRLDAWIETPRGSLAFTLLCDQFTRNMFRGDRRAFECDPIALAAARKALLAGHDLACDAALRPFYYMPFMHSEAIADQERCVALMHARGGADNLKYAIIHREAIRRFGRFPHRNPVLGRHTTPAEQAYLDGGGFKG